MVDARAQFQKMKNLVGNEGVNKKRTRAYAGIHSLVMWSRCKSGATHKHQYHQIHKGKKFRKVTGRLRSRLAVRNENRDTEVRAHKVVKEVVDERSEFRHFPGQSGEVRGDAA
jgi:hypothetical protein